MIFFCYNLYKMSTIVTVVWINVILTPSELHLQFSSPYFSAKNNGTL